MQETFAAKVTAASGPDGLVWSASATSSTAASLSGKAVPLCNVFFTISAGAGSGTHAAVIRVGASDAPLLVSTLGSSDSVAAPVAQVMDFRGGNQDSISLRVTAAAAVGVLAYSPQTVLFNVLPITGETVATSISAIQVYNWSGQADDALGQTTSKPLRCTVSTAGLVALSQTSTGCAVTVQDSAGTANVVVSAAYQALTADAVTLRVLAPSAITLSATHTQLRRISFTAACNAVAAGGSTLGLERYQNSRLSLMVTFPLPQGSSVTVDMVEVATLRVSDATKVALQADGTVQGLAPSLVNVQVSLVSLAGLTAVVNLRVLDEVVRIPVA